MRAVAYSPSGDWVATGADDIVIWDAASEARLTRFEYPAIVRCLTFSPDGHWLVSSHEDGSILVWDITERKRVANFKEHSAPVMAVAFSTDGRLIASASEDCSVILWDAQAGTKHAVLTGLPRRPLSIAFSHDGKWVASTDQVGTHLVWELQSRQRALHFTGDRNVYTVGFSPDGRWLASQKGVFQVSDGKQVMALDINVPYSIGQSLAFSPDGKWLAGAEPDRGHVVVYDAQTWKVAGVVKTDLSSEQPRSLSFSPDSQWLATGDLQGAVKLWKAHPLQSNTLLGRHNGRVKSVAFSPDGTELISAGDDQTIKLWDVHRRRLLTDVGIHTAPVHSVAFSPDGHRIRSQAKVIHPFAFTHVIALSGVIESIRKLMHQNTNRTQSLCQAFVALLDQETNANSELWAGLEKGVRAMQNETRDPRLPRMLDQIRKLCERGRVFSEMARRDFAESISQDARQWNEERSDARLGRVLKSLACSESITSLKNFATTVLDGVIAETGAQRGFILRYLPESTEAEVICARNFQTTHLCASEYGLSRTVLREVLEQGKSIVLDDAAQNPLFASAASIRQWKLLSSPCCSS